MLVLVEGIPGTGKSSTARFIRDALAAAGRPVRWWYEEERGHPVYCFRDAAELQAVVADLTGGRHARVIAAALDQWRRFAAAARADPTAIILDGCLFGYLTWSLFPVEVSEAEIAAYIAEVERLLQPCEPRLIFLRPTDLAGLLRQVGQVRGGDWASRFVARSTEHPYAQRRGLRGDDGMVTYWAAFQAMADRLFDRLACPKLAVAVGTEAWPAARRAVAEFLALPPTPADPPVAALRRYVGRYAEPGGDQAAVCEVRLEADGLVADGLPGLWARNRLVARPGGGFGVESLPVEVTFTADGSGAIHGLTLTGPGLLFEPAGTVRTLTRLDAAGQPSNDRLLGLARRIAAAYRATTQPRAILLTGSVALGVGDRFSDIDLLCYNDTVPTADQRRAAWRRCGVPVSATLTETVDQFVLAGVTAQIGHRRIADTERTIAAVLDDLDPDDRWQKQLAGIQQGVALHGAALVGRWQARLAAYPEALARAMVEQHLRHLEPVWYDQAYVAQRDARLWQEQTLVEAALHLLGVLAGLNRRYYSTVQVKRLRRFIDQMSLTPANLADRLDGLFAGERARAIANLEALTAEALTLIARHLPGADRTLLRHQPGEREQPW